MATLLHAFLQSGTRIVPILRPSAIGSDALEILGRSGMEAFNLSIPCGMSSHTQLDALIAIEDLVNLSAVDPWTLTLDDGLPGTPLTVSGLTHIESCPILVGERLSALVKITMVDERYWWSWTSAAHDPAVQSSETQPSPVLTTVGGWYTDSGASTPATAMARINTRATQYGLTALPTLFTLPSGYDIRWVADIAANPAASLALLVDCIGRSCGNVIVWDASTQSYAWRQTANLNSDYCTAISTSLDLMRGGRDAVNSTVSPSDPILNRVGTLGANKRVPRSAQLSIPLHSTEGLALHPVAARPTSSDPISLSTPKRIVSALTAGHTLNVTPNPPLGVSSGQVKGRASMFSSRPVVPDNTGAVPSATLLEVRSTASAEWVRSAGLPAGRTIRAGWIRSPHLAGQISEIQYRIGTITTGEIPYTITRLDWGDWTLGPDGRGVTDPKRLVSVRGSGVAVKSMVGSTVIDIPSQPCRAFAAKITGNAAATGGNAWQWVYTWEEVEPDGTIVSATLTSAQRRSSDQTALRAVNITEGANNPTGGTGGAGFIAPGVDVGTFSGVTMQPVPIATGTEVLMHESQQVFVAAESVVRYWFSMPNAISTVCDE